MNVVNKVDKNFEDYTPEEIIAKYREIFSGQLWVVDQSSDLELMLHFDKIKRAVKAFVSPLVVRPVEKKFEPLDPAKMREESHAHKGCDLGYRTHEFEQIK